MSAMSRTLAATVAAGLVVALGLTSFSLAHTRLFNSSTTLVLNRVPGGDSATGQLSSARGACLGGRVVTVFENTPPTKIFDSQAIGKTITTSTGAWSLPIQGGVKKGDIYFARVSKRKLVDNRRHKHTCKGVYSPQVVGA